MKPPTERFSKYIEYDHRRQHPPRADTSRTDRSGIARTKQEACYHTELIQVYANGFRCCGAMLQKQLS
ncbi:hypothetical protein SCLCIDRAFT_577721 [Scleroderma citrinum Foug A]|uniref:Uncharacterized protein n=1 Tax=Scleroderma citrinum Foug A TaxID=1036808 RepID=A0A0C2ZH64_9AGAM|nr:hypothetical protein SCLCIDRAFT_577721 [Scleroderma citrinum Foug A]